MYANVEATLAVSIVFPLLATIAVLLRFITRRSQKSTLSWDDWLLIPALVVTLALGGVMIWGVVGGGLGRPTPTPSTPGGKEQTALVTMSEYIFLCLSLPGFGLVKLSIVFFYRRIFCSFSRGAFDIATKIMIVIILLWTIGFTLALVFECGNRFWALFGSAQNLIQYCVKTLQLAQAFVISDVITDLMILCLPLPMVWKLHMSTRRKIAVSCVFLLGTLALAASVARMTIYLRAIYGAIYPPPDRNGTITELLYWSMIELGLGVVAACLPTLRLLFSNVPGGLLSGFRSVFYLPNPSYSARKSHSKDEDNVHKKSDYHMMEYTPRQKASFTNTSSAGSAYVSGDLEAAQGTPVRGIVVGRGFEQSETRR